MAYVSQFIGRYIISNGYSDQSQQQKIIKGLLFSYQFGKSTS